MEGLTEKPFLSDQKEKRRHNGTEEKARRNHEGENCGENVFYY
jgi:hypothetical protein